MPRNAIPPWASEFRLAFRFASLCMVALGLIIPTFTVHAQTPRSIVHLIHIEGEIDKGLAAYVARVLKQAEHERADAVVLIINTPGGLLDAALEIKDALLDAPIPTVAFVNRQAYSAGALITIAANEIYMAPGSVLGAATPIEAGTGETASEKVISAVRKAFASTAEARGRDPRIAEAMVDPAVAIEGLVEQGKLLTLTSKEALAYKYADGEPASLEALLALKGWEGATVVDSSPRPAERVARFVTNPVVAGLLVTLGVLGLIIELQTPGWGLGGGVGLLALGLFFFGHFIAGLAGWEGVALVALGVALIALEAFVIPGFGIAGIAGIIAFIAGIYISLVGDFTSGTDLLRAGYVVAISLLVIVAGVWASLTFLPKRRMGGLVLLEALAGGGRPTPPAGGPPSSPEAHQVSLAGRRGVALTPLHPAGIAQIDGRRVDVVTEGEWLDAGSAIEVVEDTGYRRVVRALEKPSGAAT